MKTKNQAIKEIKQLKKIIDYLISIDAEEVDEFLLVKEAYNRLNTYRNGLHRFLIKVK